MAPLHICVQCAGAFECRAPIHSSRYSDLLLAVQVFARSFFLPKMRAQMGVGASTIMTSDRTRAPHDHAEQFALRVFLRGGQSGGQQQGGRRTHENSEHVCLPRQRLSARVVHEQNVFRNYLMRVRRLPIGRALQRDGFSDPLSGRCLFPAQRCQEIEVAALRSLQNGLAEKPVVAARWQLGPYVGLLGTAPGQLFLRDQQI